MLKGLDPGLKQNKTSNFNDHLFIPIFSSCHADKNEKNLIDHSDCKKQKL